MRLGLRIYDEHVQVKDNERKTNLQRRCSGEKGKTAGQNESADNATGVDKNRTVELYREERGYSCRFDNSLLLVT